ncbi:hypothetical protein BSZ35_11530 [Salinibacter sp. 10B]|nr:hypothetical protein BSZ35_11530 [Salinibacter sp. 10B]
MHVGQWPTGWFREEERERAQDRRKLANQLQPEEWAPAYREEMRSSYEGLKEGRRLGRAAQREVAPKTHWSGPEGLQSILQSGGFSVEGFVSFNPLRPFHPNPEIPGGNPQTSDQMLSWAKISFEH